MDKDYGSEVYNALIKIIKISFSKHLNNSGIVFEKFYRISDLVSGKEHYQLYFADGHSIRFVSKSDFIVHFMNYLAKRPSDHIAAKTDNFFLMA